MIDFVLVLVIIVIVGGALAYIRKEKKRGVKCVGCPDGGTCSGKCGGCGDVKEETASCICGNEREENL